MAVGSYWALHCLLFKKCGGRVLGLNVSLVIEEVWVVASRIWWFSSFELSRLIAWGFDDFVGLKMRALRFMILFLSWIFWVFVFISQENFWVCWFVWGEEHEVHVLGKKKWIFLRKKRKKKNKSKTKN